MLKIIENEKQNLTLAVGDWFFLQSILSGEENFRWLCVLAQVDTGKVNVITIAPTGNKTTFKGRQDANRNNDTFDLATTNSTHEQLSDYAISLITQDGRYVIEKVDVEITTTPVQ